MIILDQVQGVYTFILPFILLFSLCILMFLQELFTYNKNILGSLLKTENLEFKHDVFMSILGFICVMDVYVCLEVLCLAKVTIYG